MFDNIANYPIILAAVLIVIFAIFVGGFYFGAKRKNEELEKLRKALADAQ